LLIINVWLGVDSMVVNISAIPELDVETLDLSDEGNGSMENLLELSIEKEDPESGKLSFPTPSKLSQTRWIRRSQSAARGST